RPNLWPATALDVRAAPGATLARVQGEDCDGWCSAPDGLQPGEAVTVIVRPEVIQLGPAPGSSGAAIAWTGVVRQRFFRGTRNLYTMQVGARTLTVEAPSDQAATPGTTVNLSVDAIHTWAVRS